jgi:S1-C subfamily serine protease
MALGDYYSEQIVTTDGRQLTVQPLAVEPVSDVAVLGAVDAQASGEFAAAADAFEGFCSTTEPVRLAIDELDLFVPIAAYVFTHDRGAIPARVSQTGPGAATLWVQADEPIEGGTSGGPVVTNTGRLLGIISHRGSSPGVMRWDGAIPRVHFTAPTWLVRQMIPVGIRKKLDAALPPGRITRRTLEEARRHI